ncbi:MAG TPA: hypothetical protein PKX03_02275, partial [Candidatus Paceibacterota bacterium]|nr:hypothetical protein [Candidatus Paceibacterota bacterium]
QPTIPAQPDFTAQLDDINADIDIVKDEIKELNKQKIKAVKDKNKSEIIRLNREISAKQKDLDNFNLQIENINKQQTQTETTAEISKKTTKPIYLMTFDEYKAENPDIDEPTAKQNYQSAVQDALQPKPRSDWPGASFSDFKNLLMTHQIDYDTVKNILESAEIEMPENLKMYAPISEAERTLDKDTIQEMIETARKGQHQLIGGLPYYLTLDGIIKQGDSEKAKADSNAVIGEGAQWIEPKAEKEKPVKLNIAENQKLYDDNNKKIKNLERIIRELEKSLKNETLNGIIRRIKIKTSPELKGELDVIRNQSGLSLALFNNKTGMEISEIADKVLKSEYPEFGITNEKELLDALSNINKYKTSKYFEIEKEIDEIYDEIDDLKKENENILNQDKENKSAVKKETVKDTEIETEEEINELKTLETDDLIKDILNSNGSIYVGELIAELKNRGEWTDEIEKQYIQALNDSLDKGNIIDADILNDYPELSEKQEKNKAKQEKNKAELEKICNYLIN